MHVDSIRAYCLAFSRATENLPWSEDLCFKVGGKIFTIIGLDSLRLCFKCTPDAFAELVEREDIRPVPYVGRYKWVTLDRLDALGDAELREFIAKSYEMVAAKAPTKPPTPRTRAAREKSRRKVGA